MAKITERLHLPLQDDDAAFKRELQRAWLEMAQTVNNFLTLHYQNAEPTIPVNTMALWVDADGGPKYYILGNFGGTLKKVELV